MHLADRAATVTSSASASAAASSLPALTRADVCVAGAGLSALLAAYLLVRAHRSVVVLEESAIGAVQPGIGAARVTSLPDATWAQVRGRHGAQAARVAARSHGAAIDALEAIVRRERIACELERLDAYCRVDAGFEGAARECDAALQAGIEGVEAVGSLAIPGGEWGPAVRYPSQVRLQPLKLAQGLARAIARAGGRILLGVAPARLETRDAPTIVTAGGQRVSAEVVVCTHAPHDGGRLESVCAPQIAHVVGVHVARGTMPQALYRDARSAPIDASLLSHGRGAGEVLLVGGEDPPNDDDHTAFRYVALERWARERFPAAGPVVHRGTVQALAAHELCAFGAASGAHGVQAGARHGAALTRAMLDALAIAGFVEGGDTPWPELYLRRRGEHAGAAAG